MKEIVPRNEPPPKEQASPAMSKKPIKPPKKKRRQDAEEQSFERMVRSYTAQFNDYSGSKRKASEAGDSKQQPEPKKTKDTLQKRWYE